MSSSYAGERSNLKYQSLSSAPRRFMIFDLDHGGHHPGYIQHLVRYWHNHDLPGHLDVVITENFVNQHPQIVALDSPEKRIRFVPFPIQEEKELFESVALQYSFKGRIKRAMREWQILQQYIQSLGTTDCLTMYLDTVLLRFALGGKLPCRFSSIYFRPIFHYSKFSNYKPVGRERLWQWRDRVCLSQLLRSKQLRTLFCLDPFAVERLNQIDRRSRAIYLQDPVQIYQNQEVQPETLRDQLGVDPVRTVCLLFGVMSDRKGINQLLDAVELLPSVLCKRLSLLLVGPVEAESDRAILETKIAKIKSALPVQIICRHDFVADRDIQPYFELADVILAPYQRHIGMSAILVRAAAAQTPVLSADFGLMGEVTRHYKLGLTIDSTQPDAIAQGLTRFLSESSTDLYDRTTMKQFAEQNKAEEFASKVFHHLMLTSHVPS